MSARGAEFDSILEQCSDQHRRIVLAALTSQQRPLAVDDLAETIVRSDHQESLEEVPGEALEQVQLTLHHAHLPKLEASGFVEYDRTRHLVDPTAQVDEVGATLAAIIEADPDLELPDGA